MPDDLFSDPRHRDFPQLLEQYVFCVAEAVIEQADPETQQTLIRLFIDAGQEPQFETSHQNGAD